MSSRHDQYAPNGRAYLRALNSDVCTLHDACIQDSAPRYGQPASGYGRRIPTRYLLRVNGRWRRVYCAQYGNAGTLYVEGKPDPLRGGKPDWHIVDSVEPLQERAQ